MRKIVFTLMLFAVLVACKNETKNQKQDVVETKQTKTESILDKDLEIDIEYKGAYLNPQSKPYILPWETYLTLQTKVHQLKKTTTSKLKKHLIDIDAAIVAVKASDIPKDLQTISFNEKLQLLEGLNFNALDYLEEDNITIDQLQMNVKSILEAFRNTKIEIKAIYANKDK